MHVSGKGEKVQKMKNAISLVVMVAIVVALGMVAGCRPQEVEKAPEQISVRLKWLHQAQFAGLYVAVEKGFYEQENLDVTLVPYSYQEQQIDMVIQGKTEFGVVGGSLLIQARADGLPVAAIAVIYQKNPLCCYSLEESGIKKPQDFIGKTIGLKPGENTQSYYVMMNKLGLDRNQVKEVQIGYGVDELLGGITDVSTGFSVNEPHRVIEAGHDVNIILFADYGVDVYADTLFTSEEIINSKPELVESFLRATIKGWQYAIENEEETVDIVMEYVTDSTRSHEEYMLRNSIPLIHTGAVPIGWMEKGKWQYAHDILLQTGQIEKEIDINELFNMSFLNKIYGKGE